MKKLYSYFKSFSFILPCSTGATQGMENSVSQGQSVAEVPKKRPDHSSSIVTISQQELTDKTIELEKKLIQGAKDGIFYIEMPIECKNLIADALIFAHNFYKNEAIKNQKFTGFTGYHNREHAQVESFYAEHAFWKEVFPEEIIQLATHMKVLSVKLLKKILALVLPHLTTDQLGIGTGKVTVNNGLYHALFNHYRPEKTVVGLSPHKDFGFITLLSTYKPGLIAQLHGVWGEILPKKNYFIINFGKALEMLVNDTHKLTAIVHAVEQITDQEGRVSFGLSAESSLDSSLYRLSENGLLEVVYETCQEYLTECFKATYEKI